MTFEPQVAVENKQNKGIVQKKSPDERGSIFKLSSSELPTKDSRNEVLLFPINLMCYINFLSVNTFGADQLW